MSVEWKMYDILFEWHLEIRRVNSNANKSCMLLGRQNRGNIVRHPRVQISALELATRLSVNLVVLCTFVSVESVGSPIR